MARGEVAHNALIDALIAEVRRRAGNRAARLPSDVDVDNLARRKVEPMVHGLFKEVEQPIVLAALEKFVVFLTSSNIEELIRKADWLSTAWKLADMYLNSIGAEPLSAGNEHVGLCEEMKCYVCMSYFDPREFDDFIVHEAAHTFHNCKRRTIGLPFTRTKEWILDIEFVKRETFAYSCEAFSTIVGRASSLAERRALAEGFASRPYDTNEPRMDVDEVVDIVREAASARNGWKRILARCSPPKRTRREIVHAAAQGG